MINKVTFAGQREDRNNVDKLRLQTNALNMNNQRNISNSINNLSKDSSTKNINFLMNVAEQIRYGLDCGITDYKPNNNWKEQLKKATEKSLENNTTDAKESLKARFKQVFENNKELTPEEKTVLSLRESLLNTTGLQNEIKTSENDNVRNIEKHLNYFVVSSEVNIDEKVQVLEKLNKMMSPEYKITKQLENKKPQVLGEILNDIVVKTEEKDMPTIKQVNQRHHGMCAAISIARKAMAYEYKPQYVDILMQELSAEDTMEVYDISKLGSGEKVRVPKTEIDYDYAEEKGYRIIDAATLQWMNIADTKGKGDIVSKHFSAFDKKYFDTFHDGHYNRDLKDPVLNAYNQQFRALNKAQESVNQTIKTFENRKKSEFEQKANEVRNVQLLARFNRNIAKELTVLMPQADEKEIHTVVNELIRLNQDKNNEFYIVDAEENVTKQEKIAKFIESKNPSVDKELLDSKIGKLFLMYSMASETLEYINKEIEPKTQKSKMMKYYKPLYEVAATVRTSVDLGLDIPGKLQEAAKKYNLPENSTKEAVMKKMEDRGEIVSEEILRSLQTKYNKIAKYAAVVEKAEVKGDNVQVNGLYDIADNEAVALRQVEKNLKKTSEQVRIDLNTVFDVIREPLKEHAKQIGFETGSYWVSKEGSSGLNSAQQIRIFEQMTGKRFYAEENLDRTSETIKNSNHSGITASNVYHNDHGWHAMYVADLAQVNVKNPQTGKFEAKDAIMYDNSWGFAEKKNNWIDSSGLERTDYACGRGGSTGYITNALWQNGTLVDDYKNKIAVVEGQKYRMFTDAILPTSKSLSTSVAKDLIEIVSSSVLLDKKRLEILEESLKNNKVTVQDLNSFKLRTDSFDGYKKLKSFANSKIWDSVKSQKDWDKLPLNHQARSVMERAAIIATLDSESLYKYVTENTFKTEEDFAKAEEKITTMAMKEFIETIKKTSVEDFNLKEYQVDAEKKYGKEKVQLAKEWIDKVFDPADDEEFIAKLNELKAMPEDELFSLVSKNVSNDDLGIKKVTSFDVLNAYKNQDPEIRNIVSKLQHIDTFKQIITSKNNGLEPIALYMNLKRTLAGVSSSQQIKAVERLFYKKYGVMPAFPDYDIFNENVERASAKNFLNMIKQNVEIIRSIPGQVPSSSVERTTKLNVNVLNNMLSSDVKAFIDKVHRNRVMNLVNRYVSELQKNPESQESIQLAKVIEDNFVRYSILKDMGKVFDEYLNLQATGEDPVLANALKTYIDEAFNSGAAIELQGKVMDAVSKGKSHEVGKDLLEMDYAITLPGGKEGKIKIGDSDDLVYDFFGKVAEMTGVTATATILNSIVLSDRVMTAISRIINFDKLLQSCKSPNGKVAALQVVKSLVDITPLLSLGKEASSIRTAFLGQAQNFVKQVAKMV